MKSQTALVLGATGLVGSNVVKQLLADSDFEKVIVLVRKDFEITHPKLVVQKVDFNNPENFKTKMSAGDSIFCCIGTTMKSVDGDKDAYRNIDYDIAVNAADFASAAGYSNYLLVSSVGANAASNNFYLRLKGEVENAVSKHSFKSFHIFQPSMLLGDRKETRLGESIGKAVMKALSPLFLGAIKKYKAIDAQAVASAMIAAAKSRVSGKKIYRYDDIKQLSLQAV